MPSSCRSYNPAPAVTDTVWALPLSLATTHGITVVFSSSAYLDVSVRRVRLSFDIPRQFGVGCPIRKPVDQFACADPHSLSQLGTSFLASRSLGIPRAPLSTWTAAPALLQTETAAECKAIRPNTTAFSAQHVNELSPETRHGNRKGCDTKTRRKKRPRKEVFQPHLPVRLPCYDLAPVTGSTLNGSSRLPPSGLPDFHGLTGGVYKVRERIHRAMADARLLAIPASRGRVADPDPN
jgi:hypothetical protein